MVEEHVSEGLLGRFIRVEASRREARDVVRHLLSGCPDCLETAYRLATEAGFFEPAEQAYEGVFERALAFASEEEQRLALEKLRGWAQWADLQPLPPQLRFAAVEADPRCHTFGLYDRLLEAGRLAMRSEPAEAVDVVRLAILVAERLDPAIIGQKRIADLRAAAWAQLGNVQRIASDFESARRAFNEAWRVLEEEGTNDPVDRAFIIGLEASYIKDIGEFETAESALEEALQIYKEIGDAHQQGRILLQMGDVIGYANAERALAHIRKALLLIDSSTEPRLELCAKHDLAWFLTDSGQAEEALAILDRARPLYKRFPDNFTQLRLHWLEAKLPTAWASFPKPKAYSASSGKNSAPEA